MKKLDQSGIAHLVLVALIVLALGVAGFAGYRIADSNSSRSANTDEIAEADGAKELEVDKEDEAEKVKVPKEEEKKEEVKKEPKDETDEVKKDPEPEPVKKDKIYISLNFVSATQNGDKLNVSTQLEKVSSGTCNIKLYQEGQPKVYKSKKITNTKDCDAQLDISDLATYDGWEIHAWFDGNDGKTHGYMHEKSVSLTDPS